MQQFIGPTLLASNEAQPKRKPFEIYVSGASTPARRVTPHPARVWHRGVYGQDFPPQPSMACRGVCVH